MAEATLKVNPVTGSTYENEIDYVDDLANTFEDLVQQANQISTNIRAVEEAFLEMTNGEDGHLEGASKQVDLKHTRPVSYPRERGEIHPLQNLVEAFPQMGSMVRVDYSESGSKVEKLMKKFYNDELAEGSPDHILAKAIDEFRQVGKGKCKVEIKPL